MSNILDSLILNQTTVKPSYIYKNINTKDKIKPLEDKAILLPSRIIGSPIDYAKDIGRDFLVIGKATKGKANDHELGRINDLAMKAGSLALASYLFIKNPLKLSKTMEFVGFGTFFGAMALWPKLFIQAPIKARTGVDIHQKYIDSYGRKKMLFQDPQYDMTDLYSRKDLDKIAKKMHISEDLPDRDNFIKQRAKKTAVQGNTLWMMTAGFATPIGSALMSNVAEKGLKSIFERNALKKTENAVRGIEPKYFKEAKTFVKDLKTKTADKAFNKFMQNNANKVMDEKLTSQLTELLCKDLKAANIHKAVKSELYNMKPAVKLTETNLVQILKDLNIPETVFTSLPNDVSNTVSEALRQGSYSSIANVLSHVAANGTREQAKIARSIEGRLTRAAVQAKQTTFANQRAKINDLRNVVNGFAAKQVNLENYIYERVGDQSNTFIANHWDKFTNKLLDGLNLSQSELKALSQGDMKVLDAKLTAIASNQASDTLVTKNLNKLVSKLTNELPNIPENSSKRKFVDGLINSLNKIDTKLKKPVKKLGTNVQIDALKDDTNKKISTVLNNTSKKINSTLKKGTFEDLVDDLVKEIDVYEKTTGAEFKNQVADSIKNISNETRKKATEKGFKHLAKELQTNQIGSLESIINYNVKDRALGAKASFFRALQVLDVYNQSDDVLLAKFRDYYKNDLHRTNVSDKELKNLVRKCKEMIVSSSVTDHVEKLKTARFDFTIDEYKAVMDLVYRQPNKLVDKASATVKNAYKEYADDFVYNVANWKPDVTKELERYVIEDLGNHVSGGGPVQRNTLVGKPFKTLIQDAAKQKYNTNKWLKIFGVSFAALVGITLAVGLTFGKKSKIERELEEKAKVNKNEKC